MRATTRRVLWSGLTLALVTACVAQQKQPQNAASDTLLAGIATGRTRVADLSYPISDRLTPWPGDTRTFEARNNATYEKDGYFTRSFWMLEHFGTHMDAPAHFIKGQATVDRIPPEHLIGPAVVLDMSAASAKDADYRLTRANVEEWERLHGRIPRGAIVVLRTGWAARFWDREKYYGTDAKGAHHWPGYSIESARLLIERGVSGLGIDTLSIDYGPSREFEVHKVSHGAGLYHLENLADLSALPESGAWLVAASIKLEGGSGGACRVLAIFPATGAASR